MPSARSLTARQLPPRKLRGPCFRQGPCMTTSRLLPLLATALLAAASPAADAAPACTHEGHAAGAAMPAPTLGRVDFPTSTRVPAAQAAFERGLLWLHLFEYTHAAREFQAAQQLDPGL